MSNDREEALKDFEEYVGAIASRGVPPDVALEVAGRLEAIRMTLIGDVEPKQVCEYCGVAANDKEGKFNKDGLFCCFECLKEYADELEEEKWVS